MKTALVILNWNGKKLLKEFLPTLISFSKELNTTIYVADNASTDDSIELLTFCFPEVKIIKNTTNEGFAKGYNTALQQVDADIYGLINSDIEVTHNWLSPILQVFKNQKNTAIVQPKIMAYRQKEYFEYAGAGGGFVDKLGYPYCRGRIFNSIEKDIGQYNDIAPIFWASGACFFIRSEVYNELQGFDEDYFAHQEEIDLCWRVQNKGYDIFYTGESTVYHVGGATLNAGSPQKTFLNFRNSLFTLLKNTPKITVIPLLFSRLLLDGVAGIKFILELQPQHTIAILKAHISFYKMLGKMLKKRKLVTTKTKKYYTINSIVWDYFILRYKKFRK